jgi:hypothetical protein
MTGFSKHGGRAIAQMVSRRLLTAEERVRTWLTVTLGQVYFRVVRSLLSQNYLSVVSHSLMHPGMNK